MTEYRSDTVVNADPPALFAWLSDVNNLPQYMSQMTSARALSGDEVAVTAHIQTPDDTVDRVRSLVESGDAGSVGAP